MTSNGESLALFPVDELKVEQRLIIKKKIARRDVFGQLLIGCGKSLTFHQLLPGVLSCLKAQGYEFPPSPLVVVISPLPVILVSLSNDDEDAEEDALKT